jgi:hypothetical protein
MTFRNAALEAVALARKRRVLSQYYWNRRELRIRTSFMLRGDWGDEWLTKEAEKVLTVFVNAMPVDLDSIETSSIDWSRVDEGNGLALSVVARSLFQYLEDARPFLSESSKQLADRWLAQRDRLG